MTNQNQNESEIKDIYVKQALIDIDTHVSTYVKTHICSDISDNGTSFNVNLKFANPQRISSQINRSEEMDYTDSKAELPMIIINRIGIDTQNSIIPTWIPDSLYSYVLNKEYKKQHNQYANIEYLITRVPTNIVVNYDFRILSTTKKHNDILMERFVMNNGKNWSLGKYDVTMKYTAISDSSNTITNDTERIIRSNFSGTAFTKLVPAVRNEDLIKVVHPLKAVTIQDEEEITFVDFIKKYGGK